MRRGDRWRGQAMSEEVKQKQAEDCFLRLQLLRCLETPLVSALRQGTTFQLREKTLAATTSACAKKYCADF